MQEYNVPRDYEKQFYFHTDLLYKNHYLYVKKGEKYDKQLYFPEIKEKLSAKQYHQQKKDLVQNFFLYKPFYHQGKQQFRNSQDYNIYKQGWQKMLWGIIFGSTMGQGIFILSASLKHIELADKMIKGVRLTSAIMAFCGIIYFTKNKILENDQYLDLALEYKEKIKPNTFIHLEIDDQLKKFY